VLTDFGIAKQIGDNELTATGTILGSPYYMSPEQVEGRVALDGRSDIYGLGIILYEMLTGRRPYEGDSAINIVLQHLQSPLPSLPRTLATYQPLLNLMLAKRREERFPDAERLKHYIATLQPSVTLGQGALPAGMPESAAGARRYRGGHVTQQLQVVRRQRVRTWAILGVGILCISGVLGWYFSHEIQRYEGLTVAPGAPPPAQPAPAQPLPPAGQMDGLRQQVVTALEWLGQQALEEDRLTSPPQNNAHYYYRRLLEVSPGHPEALAGLERLGERFAGLAEAEARARNYHAAQAYIEEGLRVDPDNKRLQVLRSNLQLREKTLFESVLDLMGGQG
jgi:hypothetical protein